MNFTDPIVQPNAEKDKSCEFCGYRNHLYTPNHMLPSCVLKVHSAYTLSLYMNLGRVWTTHCLYVLAM